MGKPPPLMAYSAAYLVKPLAWCHVLAVKPRLRNIQFPSRLLVWATPPEVETGREENQCEIGEDEQEEHRPN
jgi:hypothetical protein